MKTSTKILISILVIAGAAAALFAWHNHESSAPVTPSRSATASPSASPKAVSVKVYFSKHPDSDNDPSAVFAANRTTTGSGVGTYSISQLLAGPTNSETQAGYFTPGLDMSGASNCGADFSLNIAGGTATLQFCRATSLRGVVSDGQLNSEMTATLKQFSTVSKVVILNQAGHCLFDESGMDLCKR